MQQAVPAETEDNTSQTDRCSSNSNSNSNSNNTTSNDTSLMTSFPVKSEEASVLPHVAYVNRAHFSGGGPNTLNINLKPDPLNEGGMQQTAHQGQQYPTTTGHTTSPEHQTDQLVGAWVSSSPTATGNTNSGQLSPTIISGSWAGSLSPDQMPPTLSEGANFSSRNSSIASLASTGSAASGSSQSTTLPLQPSLNAALPTMGYPNNPLGLHTTFPSGMGSATTESGTVAKSPGNTTGGNVFPGPAVVWQQYRSNQSLSPYSGLFDERRLSGNELISTAAGENLFKDSSALSSLEGGGVPLVCYQPRQENPLEQQGQQQCMQTSNNYSVGDGLHSRPSISFSASGDNVSMRDPVGADGTGGSCAGGSADEKRDDGGDGGSQLTSQALALLASASRVGQTLPCLSPMEEMPSNRPSFSSGCTDEAALAPGPHVEDHESSEKYLESLMTRVYTNSGLSPGGGETQQEDPKAKVATGTMTTAAASEPRPMTEEDELSPSPPPTVADSQRHAGPMANMVHDPHFDFTMTEDASVGSSDKLGCYLHSGNSNVDESPDAVSRSSLAAESPQGTGSSSMAELNADGSHGRGDLS